MHEIGDSAELMHEVQDSGELMRKTEDSAELIHEVKLPKSTIKIPCLPSGSFNQTLTSTFDIPYSTCHDGRRGIRYFKNA